MDSRFKTLKNGNDIRGIAIKNPEKAVNLTPELVRKIAKGFYKWLKKNNENIDIKIGVGTDSRLSGESLSKACMEALIEEGAKVYDCGLSTTPAMFMSTVMETYKFKGAIMITASHLPYYYNGMKFFTSKGACEKEELNDVLELSEDNGDFDGISESATIVPLIDDYSNILVNKIREDINSSVNYDKPLQGLKIVVDAGNGAGGFFVDKVLKPLGADTEGSQFLNPDGTFPNHIPNPENKEAIESLKKAVLDSKGDLGVIFDTDVDRAAIVDNYGNTINKNAFIALLSAIVLEENKGAIIVTDSITSDGLKEFIENHGGIHYRFKRGYKNVINESIRLNNKSENCPLAIETSGHGAMKENYYLDDGAYLVCKILIKLVKLKNQGKEINDLIKELKHPREEEELRLTINDNNFRSYGENILDELLNFVATIDGWNLEPNNHEGVKVRVSGEWGSGWFLKRLSLHEPLVVINMEADTKGTIDKIKNKLKIFLGKYEKIDLKL